jgi:hypothetical protein
MTRQTGGLASRGDLNQIDSSFFSQLQGSANTHDTQLLTFQTLETNLRHGNFFVEAMRLVLSYGKTPENINN